MFIAKKSDSNGELKCRLVADFSPVNEILEQPNYPNEGSATLLKEINPEHKVFATLDLSSGYYQVELPKEYRDMFSILLPQGKYRFARIPQGSKPAGDLFNIVSDPELRELDDVKKNMDDLISSGLDYKKLYPLLDKIFSICERRNIKLNPDKFHIGRRVEFGGSIIEYVPSENRI